MRTSPGFAANPDAPQERPHPRLALTLGQLRLHGLVDELLLDLTIPGFWKEKVPLATGRGTVLGKARRVYHAETVVAIACGSFCPLFFRVFRARCFRGLKPLSSFTICGSARRSGRRVR